MAKKASSTMTTGPTSVPGVYVAGDVSRDVADGARAALAINKVLLRMGGKL
jgi:thioredoxin reductase